MIVRNGYDINPTLSEDMQDIEILQILNKHKIDKNKTLSPKEIIELPIHQGYLSSRKNNYMPTNNHIVGNLSILSYFLQIASYTDVFLYVAKGLIPYLNVLLKNYKIDEDGKDRLQINLPEKFEYYYVEHILSYYDVLKNQDLKIKLMNYLISKGAKTTSKSSNLLDKFIYGSLSSKIQMSDSKNKFPYKLLDFVIKRCDPSHYGSFDDLIQMLLYYGKIEEVIKIKKEYNFISKAKIKKLSAILDTIKED